MQLVVTLLVGTCSHFSIVEASGKKRNKKKKGKKVKGIGKHPPPSSTLLDDSAVAEHEPLIPPVPIIPDSSFHHSIGTSSSSSSSLSFPSESNVEEDVIEAVEEDGFVSIKRDWEKWRNRNDLFDYVVTKSVEFITGFINQVGNAKRPTLAALFIKRSDEVDQVLKKIKYDDNDLMYLTDHRPELAESHDKFFNAIDKINDPEYQEDAVRSGVINLFNAKKHDSVIPLINALEKRPFNGRKLKNVAIQWAFYQGAWRGIKDIVEEFHEHPAITSERYADGLIESWEYDKLKYISISTDSG